MRTPTKFVQELTDEQQSQLKAIMKSNDPQSKRKRAHAILLSFRGYSIDQIASIYEVDRDRVSQWFEWWTAKEYAGLGDEARPGRPPKLSLAESEQVVEIVREEPRSVRRAISAVAERIKKKSVGRR